MITFTSADTSARRALSTGDPPRLDMGDAQLLRVMHGRANAFGVTLASVARKTRQTPTSVTSTHRLEVTLNAFYTPCGVTSVGTAVIIEAHCTPDKEFLYALRRDFGWNTQLKHHVANAVVMFLYALRRDFGWNAGSTAPVPRSAGQCFYTPCGVTSVGTTPDSGAGRCFHPSRFYTPCGVTSVGTQRSTHGRPLGSNVSIRLAA